MKEKSLKNTPLSEEHITLGARMTPFAGWNMPVNYPNGIIAEHLHTRQEAAIFDICHMGELRVSGPETAKALDNIFPRRPSKQKIGSCKYNFLLTDSGTVVDDLIIYRIDENEFLIVVNAGTKDADVARLQELLPNSVELADESDKTAKIDLQGPASAKVLEDLGIEKSSLPGYYKWTYAKVAGIETLLSRTGYTGELGFELYVDVGNAAALWKELLTVNNVKPAGLGARDTLRLEMGYPLYGHELDTDTTPAEAGFGAMLELDDEHRFPGTEVLRSQPPRKQLAGILLEGRRAARAGSAIYADGKKIGVITSGAYAPSLGRAVAMAYLNGDRLPDAGTTLEIEAGRATIPGVITAMPFIQNTSLRKSL